MRKQNQHPQRFRDQQYTIGGHLRPIWLAVPDMWWQADYPEPIITPAIRADYTDRAHWAIRSTPRAIRHRYHREHWSRRTIGERIAMEAVYDASVNRPTHQSPAEWLRDCDRWRDRGGDGIDGIYPPWPWPSDDIRRLATVYRDYLRDITSRWTRQGTEVQP